MLSVSSYTKKYISECRAKVDEQLATYKKLTALTRRLAGASTSVPNSYIEPFELHFFHHMVLALDNYFVHRSRIMEGKDGNPLNEVRLLCNSIMHNHGKMSIDKTIKYDAARSVLKIQVGGEIRINEATFSELCKAFFAEIERKFI